MGGKSRKTGGVSQKLIEKLKNLKKERQGGSGTEKKPEKGSKNGLGIPTK